MAGMKPKKPVMAAKPKAPVAKTTAKPKPGAKPTAKPTKMAKNPTDRPGFLYGKGTI